MGRALKIALITDAYPPLKTSAAVQMRDLACEFASQGHHSLVITPSPSAKSPWSVSQEDSISILRLAARDTHVSGHLQRAAAEIFLPFSMMRNLALSPYKNTAWDVIIWYSPTIFFGPLVWKMSSRQTQIKYLILRDIFPEWAVDLGLIKKGPAYSFLKLVAAFQYRIADRIGVQSQSNVSYFQDLVRSEPNKVQVLPNWLTVEANTGCSIDISKGPLAQRKIFVYLGNMGIAQSADIFISLAEKFRNNSDVGFLFVGRGSDYARLLRMTKALKLTNVLFHHEISPREIPGLFSQCHVGLLALHPDHKTHNIPGKFVSYVCYGLPVLACVGSSSDIHGLIEREGLGRTHSGPSIPELCDMALELATDDALRLLISTRAIKFGRKHFSPERAAAQILSASEPSPSVV